MSINALNRVLFVSVCVMSIQIDTANAQQSAAQVDDIVVTAQKRAENLQDVPISVAALTSDSLKAAGVNSLDAVTAMAPGLIGYRGSSAVNFFIRGVGTPSGGAGLESPIATFVDGVYQPSLSGTTFALNNVERVEVLKGPQGTLYGRNATGGAINVITRTPSTETTVEAEISYGNLNTFGASFYGTTGIAENIAADLAVYLNDQNKGFGRNLVTGNDANDRTDLAVRSKLLFDLSDELTVTLAGDYSKTKGGFGVGQRLRPGSVGVDGRVFAGGFWDTQTDTDTRVETEIYGGSLRADYDAGNVRFSSLSAYRRINNFILGDLDMGPLPIFSYPLSETGRQFTQEFQIASTGNGNLQWLAGLFYLDSSGGFSPFQVQGALFAPSGLEFLRSFNIMKTTSYAAFGQFTYNVAAHTNITVGLRYTRDERKINTREFAKPIGSDLIATGTYADRKSYEEPTWRVAIDHHFDDDTMAYVSYNRGFRSGAYNTSSPRDPAVSPELLDAYEVGLKSTLLDRRLQLNGAAFYYDYKDIQLTRIAGAAQQILNAATAESYGIEIEMKAQVTNRLSLNGSLQRIFAKYKNFANGPVSLPNPLGGNGFVDCQGNPAGCDLSGNRMINTPKWSGTMAVDYQHPFVGGDLAWNVGVNYNSGLYFEPDNRVFQKSVAIVSAQLRWSTADDRYHFRLFGSNLGNEKYYASVSETAFGDLVQASPGRTYGIAVGVSY